MFIVQFLKKVPYLLLLSLLAVEASYAEWVFVGPRSFQRLCPQHIGGDREYKGHGPEVTIRSELYTQNAGRELYIDINMHQIETRSDWSEAQLSRNFRLYTAPFGRVITTILNGDVSDHFYVDTDHAVDRFFPSDNLVQEYRVIGDTKGNDIGNCTSDDAYLSVTLEPVWVWID